MEETKAILDVRFPDFGLDFRVRKIKRLFNGMFVPFDKVIVQCPICKISTIYLYFGNAGVYNCDMKAIDPEVASICKRCSNSKPCSICTRRNLTDECRMCWYYRDNPLYPDLFDSIWRYSE